MAARSGAPGGRGSTMAQAYGLTDGVAASTPELGAPPTIDRELNAARAERAAEADYQQRLGAKLRAVRRAQGLRLQDVEERSDGRFKAVVVGSYERGDRAVSAHRLAALAGFYGVPIADLLPDDDWPRGGGRGPGLSIAVDRLRRSVDEEVVPLRRLVQHVQWLRGDYNGRVLSLREDDLRTAAIALGLEPEDLEGWLDEHGLLTR
jgi:transcriptional regulator with XRE-family HTH domain